MYRMHVLYAYIVLILWLYCMHLFFDIETVLRVYCVDIEVYIESCIVTVSWLC